MSSWFNTLIAHLLPWVPKALIKPFAMRYVAGESMEDMLATVRDLNQHGMCATVDLLGEFIHYESEAQQAASTYLHILDRLQQERLDANISIKLSQLGLLLNPELCYTLMRDVVASAEAKGNFVRIDMEDSGCTDATLHVYLRLRQEFTHVGIVLQAYLRRTLKDALDLMATGARHFRLCKGIYIEPWTLAYRDRELVNRNYALILEEMFRHEAYVGIATHDERLIWEAKRLIHQLDLSREEYEFQMLLGVESHLRDLLVAEGHRLRVYVPYGRQWHAYCLRRLKENPNIVGHLMKDFFRSLSPSATPTIPTKAGIQ